MAQSPKFDTPPRDMVKPSSSAAGAGAWGTARFNAANKAELYYESLQYEGLANWESELPLRQRKPREIIPLFKTAIDTLHSFIWGGARFPRVTVGATRTDGQDDDNEIGPRLWDDDATALTTFVQELMRSARLDRCAAEYSRKSLVTSSSAVILSIKNGRICYYVESGKHCTPTWSSENPRAVSSLEIVYQYERQEAYGNGLQVKTVKYWFRRVIDEQDDTVYKSVPVTGAAPIWQVDPAQTTRHGLGYCPVVWVRTLPISSDAIDGTPIVDPSLYRLLDRVSYVYSLLGRNAEYSLDPQWVRKNVSPQARSNLQKSAGKVWDIEDETADKKAEIKLVEAAGSGAETASKLLSDLRKRFAEAVRIVISDPDQVAGRNISGVVLEYMHAPMIALASDLRKDLGDDALGDIVNLALRMICTVKSRGEDVYIQGVGKAVKLMMTAQLGGPWLEFPVRLQWGRFFSPSGDDINMTVMSAAAAKEAGLVSQAAATRLVADLFGIIDVSAELDTVNDEKQQAMADQQALMAKQPDPNQPPGKPKKPIGQVIQNNPKPKNKSQQVGKPKP